MKEFLFTLLFSFSVLLTGQSSPLPLETGSWTTFTDVSGVGNSYGCNRILWLSITI